MNTAHHQQRNSHKKPTDEQIEKAYLKSAKLVEIYGELALPVFERLHAEMEAIKKKRKLIRLASEVVNDNLKTSHKVSHK